MAEYRDLIVRVAPDVMNCPDPVIEDAVRDTVREWCEKTWVWQEVVDFELVEDDREAVVTLPANTALVSIVYLIEDGNQKSLPDNLFIREQTAPVVLEDESTSSKTIEARVVLKPSATTTEFPDFMLNGSGEALSYGAKARLMYDVRKLWGNPEMAAFYHSKFRSAIAQEKIKMHQGYSRRTSRVRPRRFV